MGTPICSICLKSDMLCNACNSRLESGQIKQTDIDIAKAIFSFRPDASYDSYIDAGNFVIVLADKDNAKKIIGKAGRNVKKLSEILKKQVKIVEKGSHDAMLEELLSVPIIAINKVYNQTSVGESYRVRIDKSFSRKVRFSKEIASAVLDKKIEFIFE